MKYALIALMLSSSVALAQQPEKIFNLKVKESWLNIISKGLQTQPFGEVFPLMQDIQNQIIEQNKPVEKPAEEPKKAD